MAELPAPHTARMQYEALFARLKKAEAETSTVVKYSIGPEENAAAIPIISELRGKLRKYDAYAVDAAAKHIKKLEATLKAMGEALERVNEWAEAHDMMGPDFIDDALATWKETK